MLGLIRKKSKRSYITNNVSNSVRLDFQKGYIELPKIGLLRAKIHRIFMGQIKSAAIEKTTAGEYYVSVLIETEEIKPLPDTDRVCAIDPGLKEFVTIVDTDGMVEKIESPEYFNRTVQKACKTAEKTLKKTERL